MTSHTQVKGYLLDLNGVFYVGNRVLPDAQRTIAALKATGIPYRFATNNTTESVRTMSEGLSRMGLDIQPEEIISAAYAAVLYLRQKGNPTIYPLLSEDAKRDFDEFPVSETHAEVVVLGDADGQWDYRMLNRAFKLIMQGAELVALHKGKFWQWEAGLQLDIGAFVTGLEYATETTATVVGKPAESFFQLALTDLGLPAHQVAMVGDDIEADIGGAQTVGMTGILVKTGKYRKSLVAKSAVQPDLILESVNELVDLLHPIAA